MSSTRYGILARVVSSLLVLALIALPRQNARAGGGGTTRFAKPGGLVSGSCMTWGTACQLRYALASVALPGDQIWVAKGVYKPTNTADRSIGFVLKNGVAIYGGFAGTETSFGQRNVITRIATLSGDIGTVGDAGDNSYQVVTASNTDSSAVLDGFIIAKGSATGPLGFNVGGGMSIAGGSPTLRHLRFIDNISFGSGAGMYVTAYSSPALTDVTFQNNFAMIGPGGGMYIYNSSPALLNVTFTGNASNDSGGGIHAAAGSSPTLTNVTFTNNTAALYGGAMYNTGVGTAPVLTNVTFSGNGAGGAGAYGSAIYNDSSAAAHVRNSVLWGDSASEIYNIGWGAAVISNSIVQGGCPSGSSCVNVLDANPVLGVLKNNGGFTSTIALGAGSAAIDKADDSICTSRDQRGAGRPQGIACDLGAFEVRAKSFTSQATYDGWVLESHETSGIGGGTPNTAGTNFRVGDDGSDRQYRGLLSFNTAAVPDGAKVIRARVMLIVDTVTSSDPLNTHQALLIDLAKPYFGSGLMLETLDFQAPATVASAGSVSPISDGGLYWGTLNSSGRASINKTGTTQLRLRFKLDDNDDHGADYDAFFSSNSGLLFGKPTLWVYYLP